MNNPEMTPAATVMHWTTDRLLADAQPAYGSDCASPAKPAAGTVYALPRRRIALDWRRACADGDK